MPRKDNMELRHRPLAKADSAPIAPRDPEPHRLPPSPSCNSTSPSPTSPTLLATLQHQLLNHPPLRFCVFFDTSGINPSRLLVGCRTSYLFSLVLPLRACAASARLSGISRPPLSCAWSRPPPVYLLSLLVLSPRALPKLRRPYCSVHFLLIIHTCPSTLVSLPAPTASPQGEFTSRTLKEASHSSYFLFTLI